MGITQQQLIDRRGSLGSSDMPAIMLCSPWATPYDVWLEKTGKTQPPDANEEQKRGNYIEHALGYYAADELGELFENVHLVHPNPDLHMHANVDYIVCAGHARVEAKDWRFGDWGPTGSDDVPEYAFIQAHCHMVCEGIVINRHGRAESIGPSDVCWIPRHSAYGLSMYCVKRADNIVHLMEDAAGKFWKCVESDTPPQEPGSLKVLKTVIRQADKVAMVPAKLVKTWKLAVLNRKQHDEAADVAQAAVLKEMGDAELGDAGAEGLLTYREQNSTPSVDKKAMIEAGVWDTYAKQGRHRTLRTKKRPKEKKSSE